VPQNARYRGLKSGHQEISAHYDGKVARQCLVLLTGIEFPGFVNTGVGYPRSGNDQWSAVIPGQYLKSTEAGLCPVSAGFGMAAG
jgi:hypothetical protein